MPTPRTPAVPVPASACALVGPGLRAYLTPAALEALGREHGVVLPALWAVLESRGRVGAAPTEHVIGPHRIRVVGVDGTLALGVVGIDFPEQAA
jgi:hypothetical protein